MEDIYEYLIKMNVNSSEKIEEAFEFARKDLGNTLIMIKKDNDIFSSMKSDELKERAIYFDNVREIKGGW